MRVPQSELTQVIAYLDKNYRRSDKMRCRSYGKYFVRFNDDHGKGYFTAKFDRDNKVLFLKKYSTGATFYT